MEKETCVDPVIITIKRGRVDELLRFIEKRISRINLAIRI